MKIGLFDPSSIARPSTPASSAARGKLEGSELGPGHRKAEEVSVSSLAATLAQVEQQMNATPEVDHRKVAELRAAIQSGSFRIHPERIAEKLLAEVASLLHPEAS